MHPLWATWGRQLVQAYQALVWQHRLPPMRAAIEVVPLETLWGQWRPERRCIVIAEALIRLHPWDVVIEVLKHEMAHQLADAWAPEETAHGPAFRRACARLAVAPWARATRVAPLRPVAVACPRARRLEKLHALAGSPNPHEAAAALVQARRLAAEVAAETPRPSGPGLDFVQICRRRRRIDRVDAGLVNLLVDHFSVQAVWVHTYDPATDTTFRAVELLGDARDLPFAEHVYHLVWAHLEGAWTGHRGRRPAGPGGRGAFMLGMLDGLARRLAADAAAAARGAAAAASPAAPADAVAVAVAVATPLQLRERQARLAAFVGQRHPRLTGLGRRRQILCASTWAAGAAAGARLALRRPLGGSRRPLALPAAQPSPPGGR